MPVCLSAVVNVVKCWVVRILGLLGFGCLFLFFNICKFASAIA